MLYSHLPYHKDTIIKAQVDFFRKIFTSHFIVTVRKGYSRFACERVLETEQKLQYFNPIVMAVSIVSFSFSRCSTGGQRPTLLGDGFLYCILSATSLDPNSSEPQGPFGLMWLSLPHLVYNSVRSQTATHQGPQGPFSLMWLYLPHLVYLCPISNWNWNFCLTELYNSSTPTQSPTRFLESHVGSSSSGNNCHAVHRSLSSGASVYECTMGFFFYLVPFHQPISAHAISSHNCH